MNLNDLTTLEDVEAFLEGTQAVVFEVGGSKAERYRWIEETLKRHHYRQLGKRDRGLIRGFLQHVTGYSRATWTCPASVDSLVFDHSTRSRTSFL